MPAAHGKMRSYTAVRTLGTLASMNAHHTRQNFMGKQKFAVVLLIKSTNPL